MSASATRGHSPGRPESVARTRLFHSSATAQTPRAIEEMIAEGTSTSTRPAALYTARKASSMAKKILHAHELRLGPSGSQRNLPGCLTDRT